MKNFSVLVQVFKNYPKVKFDNLPINFFMNELSKALVFFSIVMAISFTFILYKNDWTILFNGAYHQLF